MKTQEATQQKKQDPTEQEGNDCQIREEKRRMNSILKYWLKHENFDSQSLPLKPKHFGVNKTKF